MNNKTSLSAYPVDAYIVDDPRLDLDNYGCYLIERSAQEIIYRQFAASSSSNSNFTFNTVPPSMGTIVSSKIYVHYKFNVQLRGNDLGSAIDEGCAPRFCPLLQTCGSVTLQLNGALFSETLDKYIYALMKYNNNLEEMSYDFSTFPGFLDTYAEYYDPAKNLPTYQSSWGSTLDPLSSVGASTPYTPSPRRGWFQNSRCTRSVPLINGVANQNVAVDWVIEGEEMIPLSPLFWGHKEVKGLTQLNNLTLTLNFAANKFNRLISTRRYGITTYQGNQVDSTISVNATVDPSGAYANFIYLTPRITPQPIREINRYPFYQVQSFDTPASFVLPPAIYTPMGGSGAGSIVTAGPSSTPISSNFQLSSIPKRLYIFARRADVTSVVNGFGFTQPQATDTFARITAITMTLGGTSGRLAEAAPEALYRMSVKNGYKGTWDDWWCRSGGVLCIDLAQDLALNEAQAPGLSEQLQFQFNLTVQSLSADRGVNNTDDPNNVVGTSYVVVAVVVYDGMMTMINGNVIQESSVLRASDVVPDSENDVRRKIPYDALNNYYSGGTYGGSLANTISKISTGIKSAYKKGKEIVDKVTPYAKTAYKALTSPEAIALYESLAPLLMGLGYTEDQIYKAMKVKGGAIMPKKTIKSRMRK